MPEVVSGPYLCGMKPGLGSVTTKSPHAFATPQRLGMQASLVDALVWTSDNASLVRVRLDGGPECLGFLFVRLQAFNQAAEDVSHFPPVQGRVRT